AGPGGQPHHGDGHLDHQPVPVHHPEEEPGHLSQGVRLRAPSSKVSPWVEGSVRLIRMHRARSAAARGWNRAWVRGTKASPGGEKRRLCRSFSKKPPPSPKRREGRKMVHARLLARTSSSACHLECA